jgi:hypothetical protein
MHSHSAYAAFAVECDHEVYEHIIINFIILFLIEFMMWLKNGHFNNRAGKTGLGRDLQQFIHRVIHRICG